MPLRRSPTPLPEFVAPSLFAETLNLLSSPESDELDPAVGQPSHVESRKRNCTENDERSLNVIENTGSARGISWNVIDNTGG